MADKARVSAMPPRWMRDLEATLEGIAQTRDRIAAQLEQLRAERDHLMRQQCYEHGATIHYREGRYAVLHLPNPDAPSGRDRVYIGVNAGKIKEAEDAIQRGARLRVVRRELEQLERDAASWVLGLDMQLHSMHVPAAAQPRRPFEASVRPLTRR